MINLRYHIVSITAVFLALGIGLTLGSTFLDRVTVDTLKEQLDSVQAQVDETREQNESLQSRVEALTERDDAFSEALPERLLDGHLTDVPVLVLATEGTGEEAVRAAIDALAAAGADVAGTWWLTERWSLDDDDEVSELAELLDISTDDADRLRRNSAIRLAELLMTAGEDPPATDPPATDPPATDPPATDPPATEDEVQPTDPAAGGEGDTTDSPTVPFEPDLVADLVEAGFVEYQPTAGSGDATVLLPGASARYVMISGVLPQSGAQAFASSLVAELAAERPAPVVAAQGDVDLQVDGQPAAEDGRRTTFVGPIRDGELTGERVSTVDDLDTAAGLAALVLAVEDLAVPTIGHYGVAPGASTLLPGPVSEP